MKIKTMNKLTAHYDRYFGQSTDTVIHPVVDMGLHVDVLLYEPNEKFPFWKLATMGASDYKMPSVPNNTFGQFNEYVMFVDKDVDLNDRDKLLWFANNLGIIAIYAYYTKTYVSYGHSMEWENDDPEDEMIGAFIELPQIIEDIGFLRCKLGIFKTVVCLQTVLLNRDDLNRLMDIGPQAFSCYLYPDKADKKQHFLSEKHRSEKF